MWHTHTIMADVSRANQAPPPWKKPSSMNNVHPKQTQQDNVHKETKYNRKKNRFHLEHDDTHRLPPFIGITIPLRTKSPTGKQYMCTSGQQLERGTWWTQPQEYKTISLSHVVSNAKKYWLLVTVTPWVQKQFHLHMSYVTTRSTDPSINNNQPISTVWKRRPQTTL